MSNVDWPLAITLAVVFVVMSVVRWRYFRSRADRANRAARERANRVDREPPTS